MGMAARIRLPRPERETLPFLGLCLATVAVYIACAMLVIQLLGQQVGLNKKAFEVGQHVRLLIESGQMEGNIAMTVPPPTAPAPETAPAQQFTDAPPPPAGQLPTTGDIPVGTVPETSATMPLAVSPPAPVAHIVTAPLNPAPNKDLVEPGKKDEETGKMIPALPKISDKGVEPWTYYGKALPKGAEGPKIALLVAGLGINAAYTEQAIALPEYISLSFSPYAPNLAAQVKRARDAGHEVWLNLPMQPEDYPASDPGPYALLTSLKPSELKERLHLMMGLAPGIVGFLAPQHEIFSNEKQIADVMKEIKQRGMVLALRNRNFTSEESASHMLYVNRELDAARDVNAPLPEQLLTELEAVGLGSEVALGVVDYAPAILSGLPQWAAGLQEKGLTLVGASAIREKKK